MKTVLFAIAVAACGGQPPPSPTPATRAAAPPRDAAVDASPTDTAVALARMNQFADAMCKCVDQGCTEQVTADMTRWAQDTLAATAGSPEVAMTDAETRRMAQITERLASCATTAAMKSTGSGAGP